MTKYNFYLLFKFWFKEKARLIFNLYDFDKNQTITVNELVVLLKTAMTALNSMAEKTEMSI